MNERERKISDRPLDFDDVIFWLEKAGITLQCLPDHSPSLGVKLMSLELKMAAELGQREAATHVRPSIMASDISEMDEALGWLGLIGNRTMRRIVAARLLLRPGSERHRFSFRAIGRLIGANHHAVAKWWVAGIAELVAALNRGQMQRAA